MRRRQLPDKGLTIPYDCRHRFPVGAWNRQHALRGGNVGCASHAAGLAAQVEVDKLSGYARRSPPLAEAIRSLNGHAQADHTGHYSNSPPATAESVRHAVRRLRRTGQLLAAELPHWRSGGLDSPMEDFKSAAVDLRDAQAAPLNETDPHRVRRRWPCAAGGSTRCGAPTRCGRHGGRRSRNRRHRTTGTTIPRPRHSEQSGGAFHPGSLPTRPTAASEPPQDRVQNRLLHIPCTGRRQRRPVRRVRQVSGGMNQEGSRCPSSSCCRMFTPFCGTVRVKNCVCCRVP